MKTVAQIYVAGGWVLVLPLWIWFGYLAAGARRPRLGLVLVLASIAAFTVFVHLPLVRLAHH